MTRPILTLLAVLLGLTGIVWIGQGVGLLPGSFMTGQLMWAVIGAALLPISAVLFWFARRRAP